MVRRLVVDCMYKRQLSISEIGEEAREADTLYKELSFRFNGTQETRPIELHPDSPIPKIPYNCGVDKGMSRQSSAAACSYSSYFACFGRAADEFHVNCRFESLNGCEGLGIFNSSCMFGQRAKSERDCEDGLEGLSEFWVYILESRANTPRTLS